MVCLRLTQHLHSSSFTPTTFHTNIHTYGQFRVDINLINNLPELGLWAHTHAHTHKLAEQEKTKNKEIQKEARAGVRTIDLTAVRQKS